MRGPGRRSPIGPHARPSAPNPPPPPHPRPRLGRAARRSGRTPDSHWRAPSGPRLPSSTSSPSIGPHGCPSIPKPAPRLGRAARRARALLGALPCPAPTARRPFPRLAAAPARHRRPRLAIGHRRRSPPDAPRRSLDTMGVIRPSGRCRPPCVPIGQLACPSALVRPPIGPHPNPPRPLGPRPSALRNGVTRPLRTRCVLRLAETPACPRRCSLLLGRHLRSLRR
ncbi:hypothetical protein chiPu_0000339 [Chiloscyllium punctatum]|uniref:Uncharacterized protein n=1 Tax=Chiloscyllium punctatum TaxID=137246 RepID=A0A401RV11_CHIPU|nr:hypothetical protein [Chiloscyllium punctatum]